MAGSWTWQKRRECRQVMGRDNYSLSSDRNNFFNARVREARIHTDHWMVLKVLQGEGNLRNRRYVASRIWWPLETSTLRTQTEREAAFASLKGEMDRKNNPKAARAAWISKEIWQLEECREALQSSGQASV